MQNEQQHYDPRYYYVQVKSILDICPELAQSEMLCLKFQLGTKHSETTFSPDTSHKEAAAALSRKFDREAHIFKYGAEEYLNIYLEQIKVRREKDSKDVRVLKQTKEIKEGRNKKNKSSGYCRILLPPLIEHPHIRHNIQAEFITITSVLQINEKRVAVVELDLYYRLDFAGKIQMIPISANLERNVAQIGEMKPVLRLGVEGQTWSSLEAQGGIHPRWSGHFHAKKDANGVIWNTSDNLNHNLSLTSLQRLSYLAANTYASPNNRYFDCCIFDLRSAGSSLTLEVLSYPLIGKEPDLAGSACIRIEDAGFLKHPRQELDNIYETREVALTHREQNETTFVGTLKMEVRFVFDKSKVVGTAPLQVDLQEPVSLLELFQ